MRSNVVRAASLALAGVLLAGCLQAAPAPDVEGTVQARVSATVQALARAQTTRAATPVSTVTVIPIGTAPASGTAAVAARPSTAPASGSPATPPAPAATAGAAAPTAPAATAGAAAPTAPAATAGAAAPTAPAATAAATIATGSPPAAVATPTATLGFGTLARIAGFSVTVNRYEWGFGCPGGGSGRPSPGSKFVTVYASGRNEGADAVSVPAVQWTLDGYAASPGAAAACGQASQTLAGACPAGSRLSAGAGCEGWLLFEVPDVMPVAGAVLQARAGSGGAGGMAQWRLPAGGT